MNVLNLEHISKIYGDKVIFDDISCGIHQGDKIGIIGINGTGKATFLRILAGLEEADDGQVIMQNGLRISFLSQHPTFPEGATILSYVTQGQREQSWNPETEAHMVLNKLGIEEHEEEIAHLSGGQKKRVALAAVLVNPTDVLILDEPTNHLDNEMASWLEDYLNRFKGIVIMVTHDRYFLDRVTNKILEISHGKLYSYEAKYSEFLELKAQREEMEMASERKKQSILRMEIEWAKRGCRARSTKQRARLDRLEEMKNSSAPVRDTNVAIDSVETRMGKKTIELHHISKKFGDRICIRDFDYIVLKNQRLGIIGPNGCGKSTLLKSLNRMNDLVEGCKITGDFTLDGENIYKDMEITELRKRVGMVFQKPNLFPMSIYDNIAYGPRTHGIKKKADLDEIVETTLRQASVWDETKDRLKKSALGMSGGQQQRICIARALAVKPEVLLMDEPTSALDPISTIKIEELATELKKNYTIVIVTHNMQQATRISDKTAFFLHGEIVEFDETQRIFSNPKEQKTLEYITGRFG